MEITDKTFPMHETNLLKIPLTLCLDDSILNKEEDELCKKTCDLLIKRYMNAFYSREETLKELNKLGIE